MATNEEIDVLEALAVQGENLKSKPGTCIPPFVSRLHLVDRQHRFLLLESSAEEAANIALLALPHADLQIDWGEWRIAFSASNPTPVLDEKTDAIRLDFPDTVEIGRRRLYQRTPDPKPTLRCVDYVGDAIAFEFTVTNVSQGGLSLRVDFAADELVPGTVLTGCRLECAGREPASIDLEVEYTTSAPLNGASRIGSIGCRFVSLSPAAMALIVAYTDARPSA